MLMLRKNYNIKKTISVKQFISEFGKNFSEQIKKRLLELEVRCVLVRQEENYILQIHHVEHTTHDVSSKDGLKQIKKEYAFGQFIVVEEVLYFSEKCSESNTLIESPIVSTIFNALTSESIVCETGVNAKQINDSNIDFIINSILSVCPEVSKAYRDIVDGMLSRSRK
jgi:hypothetical protein